MKSIKSNTQRKSALLIAALLSGLLTCSASITPYGYWSFSTTGNPGAATPAWGMSSYPGVNGPPDQGNCLIVPNFGVGGPLGGTNGNAGITSTSSVKTHALYSGNGGNIWVGNGSGWGIQYSNNWVLECWTLPDLDGTRNGYSLADIVSIGEIQTDNANGGASGSQRWGCWFRAITGGTGSGIVYVQCMCAAPDASTFQLGPDVLVKNTDSDNRWIHLAAVRDNLAGTVTFYTNGVVCASTSAANVKQNPNAPPNTAFPGFGGAQGSPEYSGSTPYEGYIDEFRISSFADGQFSVTNLLTRAPGPSIVLQPQSTTVWAGGAAPFRVVGAYDTSLTYQWYRGTSPITDSGGNSSIYVLPATTSGDDGATFKCVLTDYTGLSVTSSVATLKVVANNPSNVAVYQTNVLATPGLVGYYPVDGCTTNGVLTNVVDITRASDGTVEGDAYLDGGTNRAFGQQNLYFPGATLYAGKSGDVQIPNNSAFEFGGNGGFGSIEAVLYVDPTIANVLGNENPTWFAENGYYTLMANASAVSVAVSGNGTLSWLVPGGLSGKTTHVVITFDNAANVTAYANGQSLGTLTIPFGFAGYTGSPFYIGWDGTGVQGNGSQLNLFHGAVDELAIYGTNLTSDVVVDHYNKYFYGTNTSPASIVSVSPGSKTLWTGFANQTLTVVAAGTPPYTYRWYTNAAQVTGATSSSVVLSNLPTGFCDVTVVVQGSVGAPATSAPVVLTVRDPLAGYETAVATSSGGRPQAFWRLNEASGTTAADLNGTHDAKYFGGYLHAVAGAFAGQTGVQFFGTNAPGDVLLNASRVEAPFYPELNNPQGPITIEYWYRHDNPGPANNSGIDNYAITTCHQTGGTDNGIMFIESWNTGGGWTVIGWCYGNNNPARSLTTEQANTKIVKSRWEHAVFTWDGDNGGNPGVTAPGSGNLYVNGVLESTRLYSFHQADGTTRLDQYANNDAGPFVVGNRPKARNSNTTTYSRPFPGCFADVAVYNYALSAADVSNHFFFAASPATITSEPVGATNTESFTASVTLTVGVGGQPNTSYQWYKDGSPLSAMNNPDGTAHYPTVGNPGFHTQGVDSPKLVISELFTNDTGNYQLFVSNPVQGTNSVVVSVLINPNTTAPLPVATGAQALGLTISGPLWANDLSFTTVPGTLPMPSLVKVTFNTRLDFVTATNPLNYVLSGGSGTVSSVAIANSPSDLLWGADNKTVTLMTTGLDPGSNYVLTVSNVKEQYSRGEAVAPTTLYFTTPVLTPGTLCWDYYYKIPRSTSGDNLQKILNLVNQNQGQLPYVPQRELSITNFDTHQLGNPVSSSIVGNQGDDYVAVVSGWLTPTNTDSYDFYLGADDRAGFWMNQNGPDPAGTTWPPGASTSGSWPFVAGQLYYTGIPLSAGTSYYVQAILLEDGGGDWVAVGWTSYGGAVPTTGIPGEFLSSYSRGAAPKFNAPVGTTISWTGLGRLMQSTNVALPLNQWTPVPGNPSSPYVMPTGATSHMFYRLLQ